MTCPPHLFYQVKDPSLTVEQHYLEYLQFAIQKKYLILPMDHNLEAICLNVPLKFRSQSGYYVNEPKWKCLPENFSIEFNRTLPAYKVVMHIIETENRPMILNVTGPMTLFSYLLPLEEIYKMHRKNRVQFESITHQLVQKLSEYIQEAYQKGIRHFFLSDPLCKVELLGIDRHQAFFSQGIKPLVDLIHSLKNTRCTVCPLTVQNPKFTLLASTVETQCIHPYKSLSAL